MNIEELKDKASRNYAVATKLIKEAETFEQIALQKFLAEHNLDGVVRHKKFGREGVLRLIKVLGKSEVGFFSIKWDGTIYKTLNRYCSMGGLLIDFEKILDIYEPVGRREINNENTIC